MCSNHIDFRKARLNLQSCLKFSEILQYVDKGRVTHYEFFIFDIKNVKFLIKNNNNNPFLMEAFPSYKKQKTTQNQISGGINLKLKKLLYRCSGFSSVSQPVFRSFNQVEHYWNHY